MDLFVNELSLHGQFNTSSTFVRSLKEMLSCRRVAERYRRPFWCPRALATREALPGLTLREAVQQTRDANIIRLVMAWLDRHGPFWDDTRSHNPDDYFEHAGEVVTDCGLGEAAFRLGRAQAAASVGFAESSFCHSPLPIIWRRSDTSSDALDLLNFWQPETLEAYLRDLEAAPQSWAELIAQAQVRFQQLTLIDSILDGLHGEPFSPTIAERVLVLLGILDRLKICFDADARFSVEGHQLLQQYFHGDRALFTDESETNKRTFARQLTFRLSSGATLFCPYHGKISFRYYRVHHSWPIRPDEPLYIVYIGPKITRG
jgi:hypothetical protein